MKSEKKTPKCKNLNSTQSHNEGGIVIIALLDGKRLIGSKKK
jgi:hypothetical protein